MKNPNYIMIHHSAVSHQKNKDQFKANNNYHKAKWNFKSSLGYYLGYNYEISAKGKTRQAREDGVYTAACPQKDMNDGRAIHICIDGNFNLEKPTDKQIFALRDLLRKLVKKYQIERNNIIYHKDVGNTVCPGNYLDGEKEFIRNLVEWENLNPELFSPPKLKDKQLILDLLNKLSSLIKKTI